MFDSVEQLLDLKRDSVGLRCSRDYWAPNQAPTHAFSRNLCVCGFVERSVTTREQRETAI